MIHTHTHTPLRTRDKKVLYPADRGRRPTSIELDFKMIPWIKDPANYGGKSLVQLPGRHNEPGVTLSMHRRFVVAVAVLRNARWPVTPRLVSKALGPDLRVANTYHSRSSLWFPTTSLSDVFSKNLYPTPHEKGSNVLSRRFLLPSRIGNRFFTPPSFYP